MLFLDREGWEEKGGEETREWGVTSDGNKTQHHYKKKQFFYDIPFDLFCNFDVNFTCNSIFYI